LLKNAFIELPEFLVYNKFTYKTLNINRKMVEIVYHNYHTKPKPNSPSMAVLNRFFIWSSVSICDGKVTEQLHVLAVGKHIQLIKQSFLKCTQNSLGEPSAGILSDPVMNFISTLDDILELSKKKQ